MKILEKFISIARGKKANIGIGLGELKSHNIKILNASLQFLRENSSKIYFFGDSPSIERLSNNSNYKKNKSNLVLVECKESEKEIFDFIDNNIINSIVRGSLSSSKFLKMVKTYFNVSTINRLALLETFNGFQFFYGPVGIDECNNYEKKISFIKKAINVFNRLQIKPKVSILSGGRKGDIGRNILVDETINVANDVVEYFQQENPDLIISHDEILIENAIEKKSNLIIAPDGISGNLIYRTLVHLGGGKAYGAIYMDIDQPIIDTSRAGKISEIQGALLLALALAP